MTSTLNPTCPLCGLRYASKPLLELHIREDHRPQPGRLDAGGTRASSATMPAARPQPGQVMTVPRRVLRALRHVNDELTRASEAIIRSARAPQSRPQAQAPAARDTGPATIADRADRAA